jgi:hypothetical protein
MVISAGYPGPFVEAVDTRLGDAGAHACLAVAVHFDQHVAFAVQRGDDVAAVERHRQLDDRIEGAQSRADRLGELLDAFAGRCRHRHRARVRREQIVDRARIGDVDLVDDQQFGTAVGADIAQDSADGDDLILGVVGAAVHDVQQHVGAADLLERRLERLDELVRQPAHEPDGVAEQAGLAAR